MSDNDLAYRVDRNASSDYLSDHVQSLRFRFLTYLDWMSHYGLVVD